MLRRMEPFALSERWNGWKRLDVMLKAARAAVEAGPLDPLVCVVTIETDEDTFELDSLDALEALLAAGDEPMGIDIWIAQEEDAEASLAIVWNGYWVQINGAGTDWTRARQAYHAAQVEFAMVAGITTFKLPTLPKDTVQDVRKKVGAKDMDPGREEADAEARQRKPGKKPDRS